jgi:protein SCO1
VRAGRALAALALCAALCAAEPTAMSVWQLAGHWSRAGDGEIELASLRGAPSFLLFFYGTCESVCPALVHDLQTVEGKLAPEVRARVHFVLVTIDPERDTLERLAALARAKQLDPQRWFLLRGSPDQVSELAATVDVHYRPTGTGQFAHTIRIILLDRDGVERAHWDGADRPLDAIARTAARWAAPG